jgi:molecular chaperone DnaK
MRKDAEEHAAEDKKQREQIDARNKADSIAYQTEKQVGELGDKVDASLKTEVMAHVEKLRGLAKDGTPKQIEAEINSLQQTWNKFHKAAEEMYRQATAGQAGPGGPQPPPGAEQQQQPKSDEGEVIDADFEVK